MDFPQERLLCVRQRFPILDPRALRQTPQGQRLLAQFRRDQPVHLAAVLGVEVIRVDGVRDQAILPHQVIHHVPLAAVRDGVLEELLDQTTGEILADRLDDLLQEPVCLLDLVPVEEVGLAELQLGHVVFPHQRYAEDIGRREDPAPARRALVGDGAALQRDPDVEHLGIGPQSGLVGEDLQVRALGETRDRQSVLRRSTGQPSAVPLVRSRDKCAGSRDSFRHGTRTLGSFSRESSQFLSWEMARVVVRSRALYGGASHISTDLHPLSCKWTGSKRRVVYELPLFHVRVLAQLQAHIARRLCSRIPAAVASWPRLIRDVSVFPPVEVAELNIRFPSWLQIQDLTEKEVFGGRQAEDGV